jgi:hypothetical protein
MRATTNQNFDAGFYIDGVNLHFSLNGSNLFNKVLQNLILYLNPTDLETIFYILGIVIKGTVYRELVSVFFFSFFESDGRSVTDFA